MKNIFYTLIMAVAIGSLIYPAHAEGVKRTGQNNGAGSYSGMEPAAGDPTRVAPLDERDVQMLQRSLNDRGYASGPVDGILGPKTKEAIRRFQEDNDLTVTGAATPETLDELGLNIKAPARDRKDYDRETWQEKKRPNGSGAGGDYRSQ